jgi:hypothetical protein
MTNFSYLIKFNMEIFNKKYFGEDKYSIFSYDIRIIQINIYH